MDCGADDDRSYYNESSIFDAVFDWIDDNIASQTLTLKKVKSLDWKGLEYLFEEADKLKFKHDTIEKLKKDLLEGISECDGAAYFGGVTKSVMDDGFVCVGESDTAIMEFFVKLKEA